MEPFRYRIIIVTTHLSVLVALRSWEEDIVHESFSSDFARHRAASPPAKQLIQVQRTTTDSHVAEMGLRHPKMENPSHTESVGLPNQNLTLTLHVSPAVGEELAIRQHRFNHRIASPAVFPKVPRSNTTRLPHPNKSNSKLASQQHPGSQAAAAIADANDILQQQRQLQQQQKQEQQRKRRQQFFFQLWERLGDLVEVEGWTSQHVHNTKGDVPTHTMLRVAVVVVIVCFLAPLAIAVAAWNFCTFPTSRLASGNRIRSSLKPDAHHQPTGIAPSIRIGPAAVWSGTTSPQGSGINDKEPFLGRLAQGLSRSQQHQQQQQQPCDPGSCPPSFLSCATDTGLQLFQELVVPAGKECFFFLPQIPSSMLADGGTVKVDDMSGRPVFCATFFPQGDDTGKRLVLRSAVDDFAFGYFQEAAKGGTLLDGLILCHYSGVPFGTLQPDKKGGFMMHARNGRTISIQDDEQSQVRAIHVYHNRLLAIMELSSWNNTVQWILRIGPAGDAGLMVLMMFGTAILRCRLKNLERATCNAGREVQ